jgi:hypothetical protein
MLDKCCIDIYMLEYMLDYIKMLEIYLNNNDTVIVVVCYEKT